MKLSEVKQYMESAGELDNETFTVRSEYLIQVEEFGLLERVTTEVDDEGDFVNFLFVDGDFHEVFSASDVFDASFKVFKQL